MTAKDFLSQAYRIDQRINSKLEQVQSLRELATKATAALSDAPAGGNRNVHSMGEIIGKMIDLEAEINADIDRLVDLKREIVTLVNQVANHERQTLLELRYLCFKKWEEIAVAMGYGLHHLYKIHNRALDDISAVMEKRIPKDIV